MAIDSKFLIDTVQSSIDSLEERSVEYKKELKSALMNIILNEHNNMTDLSRDINIKAEDEIDKLSKFLDK